MTSFCLKKIKLKFKAFFRFQKWTKLEFFGPLFFEYWKLVKNHSNSSLKYTCLLKITTKVPWLLSPYSQLLETCIWFFLRPTIYIFRWIWMLKMVLFHYISVLVSSIYHYPRSFLKSFRRVFLKMAEIVAQQGENI